MDEALLDTDILNEVLKQKNAVVVRQAADYLRQYGQFSISSMTRYEILRGLREKNAVVQLERFSTFCERTQILPIADDVLDLAAGLWGHGRKIGRAPQDADLIIAATSIKHGLGLVTGNASHFDWVPGLTVSNWRNE